mmetsp:Transcript_6883/g.19290  ORF Transcript_6883/g.19290 Transcript_6883/m.19290 type:complete len:255 (-) Transcript_6883:218-982(-)
MSPLPDLDEEVQAKVLACVSEPRASITCRAWKDTLYKTLHLECQYHFNHRLHSAGKLIFCYGAVRPLGEDFEESASYNFTFSPGGTYRMQWTRTYDAWSSQTEQHFGAWRLFLDEVLCETLEPPEAQSDREVRHAPPGYRFRVPTGDIVGAGGVYYQAPIGAPAAPWELAARTGKQESGAGSVTVSGMWRAVDEAPAAAAPAAAASLHAPLRPDARFVEIDGDMHEVSGDIVANWPENEWPRLMKCRLRFGIVG